MGTPSITINFYAGWIGILAGLLAGAGIGLFFHDENWLGGYGSWPRRMLRLGHISLFGIAFLNLSFAFSLRDMELDRSLWLTSYLFVLGAVAMPVVCFLSAWRKGFRHMFFIPVASLIFAVALFLWQGIFA